MKTYVISLDRRPDRRDYVRDIFGQLGLAFEFISAVDGTDPMIQAEAQRLPRNSAGNGLSVFAHACLLSHRKAWQRFIDSGESHAIVMEDDIVPAKGLDWLNADGWFPDEADIVKLETFMTRIHIGRRPISSIGNRGLFFLNSDHPGAAAYALTRRAAQLLMDRSEAACDPVDEITFRPELGYLPGTVICQMVPAPFVQMDRLSKPQPSWARSDIIERSVDDAVHAKKPETLLGRVLRRVGNEVLAALRRTRYVVVPHG